MKLQYIKKISNVVDFHIRTVSITNNLYKQAHVLNKLGRFGTGVTLAPVLLFELYLAINQSFTSHSPSRKNSALRVTRSRQ